MLSIEDLVPLHMAEVAYPAWHPLAGTSGPVFAFALRHPDGVILVDTGLGPPHPFIDEHYQPVRTEPQTALYSAGMDPASVVAIVTSHLHFDHCGGNELFPGVPIHVQRAEREAARAPRYTIPEFVDFPGARYVLLDGDTEVAPGVTAIATPGHTPGHQSVRIDTAEGPVAVAGQAADTVAEFADPGAIEDAQRRASLLRLHELRPVRVYFSHDAATWPA